MHCVYTPLADIAGVTTMNASKVLLVFHRGRFSQTLTLAQMGISMEENLHLAAGGNACLMQRLYLNEALVGWLASVLEINVRQVFNAGLFTK